MRKNRNFYHSGRALSLLLALLMVITLVPVTAFASVDTPITDVRLGTTVSLPESFEAGKTIPEEILSEDNIICYTLGCKVSMVYWMYQRFNNGSMTVGEITAGTVLQEGDTVELWLFIDVDAGCKFDVGKKISVSHYEFNGSLSLDGQALSDVNILKSDSDEDEDTLVGELEFTVKSGENPPAGGNRFEIVLGNVPEGGSLAENVGVVQYAVVTEYAQSQINPVYINADYDGEADGVTLTVGNTGGENPNVKYTYTVKDPEKQFKLYVIPGMGKTATVTRNNQGVMEVIDKVSYKSGGAPSFTIKNVPAGGFYKVEFFDTGSEPDQTITTIDIGNIWTTLDPTKPVPFTAEVKPGSECEKQMEIASESWVYEGTDFTSEISSTDAEEYNPFPGKTYSHKITLKAKDGYVFSKNFENNLSAVTFIYGGSKRTDVSCAVSADGKEITVTGVVADVKAVKTIDAVKIVGAKLKYNAGEVPTATAGRGDENAAHYRITEVWEEIDPEKQAAGKDPVVAIWYSGPDFSYQGPTITKFEEGKSYRYQLIVVPENGYSFAANMPLTINGKSVTEMTTNITSDPTRGAIIVLPSFTVEKGYEPQSIDTVKIKNVTLSYKDGDKFVFTAESEEPDLYKVYLETYRDKATGDYLSSRDFFNNEEHRGECNLLDAAVGGKTYSYSIWIKPVEKDGNPMVTFENTTKIVINGKTYNLADNGNKQAAVHDQYDLMFYAADDIVVPAKTSTQPSIIEGANGEWTKGSADGLKFKSNAAFADFRKVLIDGAEIAAENYEVKEGSTVVTLKDAYLATLSVGKHTLSIVSANGTAATEFEIKAASATPTQPTNPSNPADTNKPDSDKTTESPKTGDNSNMALWIALLFASCSGLVAVTVYGRKKKVNNR